jgi:hypothetical protein
MRKAKARDQASRACAPSKGRAHKTSAPIQRRSPQAAGLGPVRSASKSPKQQPLRRRSSGSPHPAARSKDATQAAALDRLRKPGQAVASQPGAGPGLLLSLSLPSSGFQRTLSLLATHFAGRLALAAARAAGSSSVAQQCSERGQRADTGRLKAAAIAAGARAALDGGP